MNVNTAILEAKNRDPFVPFRIVVASGDKYLIERGDNLVEMKTEFFYALPNGESWVWIRKKQIVAVEHAGPKRSSRRKAS
jgi:hypothetical protein